MVQTYLSSAIDDHSRMILASEFYDNQQEAIVEDTFRKTVLKFGHFDRCYFDNGTQHVAKQLKLSLARLSIRIAHAPVESGTSKEKIDGIVAAIMAFDRCIRNQTEPQGSVYDERGLLVL